MKIIVTEEEITLSDEMWSCDLVFSNTPGVTYSFGSNGYPMWAINNGSSIVTVSRRGKEKD